MGPLVSINRDIYNTEVVNRVMAEVLTKYFPGDEDGDPEEELSQDEN